MMQTYGRLCSAGAKAWQDTAIKGQMAKTAHEGKIVANLTLKLKTHKEEGAIVPRFLHANANFAFRGLGSYINTILMEKVVTLHHIVKDAVDLKKKI